MVNKNTEKLLNKLYEADYIRIVKETSFERDVWQSFLHWKQHTSNLVLRVDGARQIGKTSMVKRFAYEHYHNVIYIDLTNVDNLNSFHNIIEDTTTRLNGYSKIFDYFLSQDELESMTSGDGVNNTVLIIDEIQLSKRVYSALKPISRSLDIDIIVTGSYMSIVKNIDYLDLLDNAEVVTPAGYICPVKMFPMSFKEYYQAVTNKTLVTLDENMMQKDFSKEREVYNFFKRTGGYPGVVAQFLNDLKRGITEEQILENVYNNIGYILELVSVESRKYFKQDAVGSSTLTSLFYPILETIMEIIILHSESKIKFDRMHNEDFYLDTSKMVYDILRNDRVISYSEHFSYQNIQQSITWLIHCGILGEVFCVDKTDYSKTQGTKLNLTRIYVEDIGIFNYFANHLSVDKSNVKGSQLEIFVYAEFAKKINTQSYMQRTIGSRNVNYSVVDQYELDVFLKGCGSCSNSKELYGIELKSGRNSAKSLEFYIKKKLVTKGVYATNTDSISSFMLDDVEILEVPNFLVVELFPYEEVDVTLGKDIEDFSKTVKALNLFNKK